MKMRVWKRMEVEPVFAHRAEMTLGLFSYSPASKVLSYRKQSIKTREPWLNFSPDENREVTALRLHRLMELNLVRSSILLFFKFAEICWKKVKSIQSYWGTKSFAGSWLWTSWNSAQVCRLGFCSRNVGWEDHNAIFVDLDDHWSCWCWSAFLSSPDLKRLCQQGQCWPEFCSRYDWSLAAKKMLLREFFISRLVLTERPMIYTQDCFYF